jgi:hypothetical protein
LDPLSKKRNFKKKGIKPYFPKPDEFSPESNEYLSFIAGYTSSGVLFGLTWEEDNPNNEENGSESPTKKK